VRKFVGILAGIVAAFIAIMAIQMISSILYPMPDGLGLDDKAGLQAHIETLPITAFCLVIASYVLGGLAGGFMATLVSKVRYFPALIVGGLFTVFAIMNGMAIPQPLWVSVLSVLVFIPCAWLGAKAVKLA